MRSFLTYSGVALVTLSAALASMMDAALIAAAGLCLVFGVALMVAASSYPRR